MWILIVFIVIAVLATIVRKPGQKSATVRLLTDPFTTDDLQRVPVELRPALVDADIIVRWFLSSIEWGQPLAHARKRSELAHSVSSIKRSLILVTAYRAGQSQLDRSSYSRLREAYTSLAYFPPTTHEALEEWNDSGKDLVASKIAARHVGGDSDSFEKMGKEAQRLMMEFDSELQTAAGGASAI